MKKLSLISFFTFLIVGLVVTLWEKQPEHTTDVKWEKFVTDPGKKTKVVKSEPKNDDLAKIDYTEYKKKTEKSLKKKFRIQYRQDHI